MPMFLDDLDNSHAGRASGHNTGPDSGHDQRGDTIVDTMIVRAVRDAQQSEDSALRQEARTWLWVCCPDLADQLDLPDPQATEMADDVAAYTQRQRAA